jgi:hypothetical protein
MTHSAAGGGFAGADATAGENGIGEDSTGAALCRIARERTNRGRDMQRSASVVRGSFTGFDCAETGHPAQASPLTP